MTDAVKRLTEAGATVIQQYDDGHGVPNHILMSDPEGNEFCIL